MGSDHMGLTPPPWIIFMFSGGDPWSPPTRWSTLYPTLHLNLDDQTLYTLHGGATHISTQVCDYALNSFFHMCLQCLCVHCKSLNEN